MGVVSRHAVKLYESSTARAFTPSRNYHKELYASYIAIKRFIVHGYKLIRADSRI